MAESKPAIKSLGVWGSLTGFIPLAYKLIGIFSGIPTDLVSDTQAFFIGTVATAIALIGRWKATLPISGLFKTK